MQGALTRVPGAQAIALAPLGDSDTAALIGELLGSDPSVGELAAVIAEPGRRESVFRRGDGARVGPARGAGR